jgi:hypothetical protein
MREIEVGLHREKIERLSESGRERVRHIDYNTKLCAGDLYSARCRL